MLSKESALDDIQDELREQLLKYTRKAFHQIPRLSKPHILDVGCGSGVPTVELAKLSQGIITGLDIDEKALNRLENRAKMHNMTNQVRTVTGSLRDMQFAEESFDIIWAEGSIAVIGFKQGLLSWKRYLKPGGYLVVHDEAGNINQKTNQIKACGYELIEYFELNNEVWWNEYYVPFRDAVQQLKKQEPKDPKLVKDLEQAQREIDGYQVHPERYRSAYFIMQKKAGIK